MLMQWLMRLNHNHGDHRRSPSSSEADLARRNARHHNPGAALVAPRRIMVPPGRFAGLLAWTERRVGKRRHHHRRALALQTGRRTRLGQQHDQSMRSPVTQEWLEYQNLV